MDVQATPISIAQAAIDAIVVGEYHQKSISVAASQHGHGHYSAPVGFALAKHLGQDPQTVAQTCASMIHDSRYIASATGAFVNITLTDEYLLTYAQSQLAEPFAGLQSDTPQTVVIDYSGPNIAKTMHVGHLRSTVIGDALARMYAFAQHTVIKQNHVGDWGTQFGMLVEMIIEQGSVPDNLEELNNLYQQAKHQFDTDEDFAHRARVRVTLLQGGDIETLKHWSQLVTQSHHIMQIVYDQLNVTLTPDDIRGESAYNNNLQSIVSLLIEQGVGEYNDGAVVTFVPGYTNREGSPLPLLVQKSDGGYLYATTDLAALQYRGTDLDADKIIYVVDSRQKDHFAMLFYVAQQMGWHGHAELSHVPFGSVLDAETKKPFKTREGVAVSLQSLITQADEQATQELHSRHEEWTDNRIAAVNHDIALAAIKYADLSNDRENDYVFDIDKMVSFEGDTGPYLQYTTVRFASMLDNESHDTDTGAITVLSNDQERQLILVCAQVAEYFALSLTTNKPHIWARYLHQLAVCANQFYNASPIKPAEGEVRQSRLALAHMAYQLLSEGIELLGINQPIEM